MSKNVAVVVANVALVNGTTVFVTAAIPVTPVFVTVIDPAAVPEAPSVRTVPLMTTWNATPVPDPDEVTVAVATEASAVVPRIPARIVKVEMSAFVEVQVPRIVARKRVPAFRVPFVGPTVPGRTKGMLINNVSVVLIAAVAVTRAAGDAPANEPGVGF